MKKFFPLHMLAFSILLGFTCPALSQQTLEESVFKLDSLQGVYQRYDDSLFELRDPGAGEIVSFRVEDWISRTFPSSTENPTTIHLMYKKVDNLADAAKAWGALSQQNSERGAVPEELGLGEIAVGGAPYFVRFIKGRYVVSLRLDVRESGDVFSEEARLQLFGSLIANILEDTSPSGGDIVGDFSFEATKISESPLLVRVRSNRAGIFQYSLQKSDGQDFRVVQSWSPLEASALDISLSEELEAGSYLLTVSAEDELGRARSARISFAVRSTNTGNDQILEAIQDSTIRAQDPHRNEGANPRLFLSHRPEKRNKSNNPIVGFDLANANLSGLTKASLVLNVQECDVPRRWGRNGRSVIVQPMNQAWLEGNGRFKEVRGNQGKTKGSGQGVTWFSPVDENIQNNRPNGSLQWMGARNVLGPATAPAIRIQNRQTGPVVFDVTQDVLSGFRDGWMVRKQNEGKYGNIRFYSREGAAEAGDPNLAPQLILEHGGQVSQSPWDKALASLGLLRRPQVLGSPKQGAEIPSYRDILQRSPVAAAIGENVVSKLAGSNPLVNVPSRLAYRVWLNQGLA